jgi:hypothetical protein
MWLLKPLAGPPSRLYIDRAKKRPLFTLEIPVHCPFVTKIGLIGCGFVKAIRALMIGPLLNLRVSLLAGIRPKLAARFERVETFHRTRGIKHCAT